VCVGLSARSSGESFTGILSELVTRGAWPRSRRQVSGGTEAQVTRV
jgi:hypothetical protein